MPPLKGPSFTRTQPGGDGGAARAHALFPDTWAGSAASGPVPSQPLGLGTSHIQLCSIHSEYSFSLFSTSPDPPLLHFLTLWAPEGRYRAQIRNSRRPRKQTNQQQPHTKAKCNRKLEKGKRCYSMRKL